MLVKFALYALAGVSAVVAESLRTTLASHDSLSILNGLLHQFDLLDEFDSASNVTLLAPTDQAYKDLAQWGFNVSEVDPFIARALLTYHLLDGEYTSKGIAEQADGPEVVHTHLKPPVLTNVSTGAAVKLSPGESGSGLVVESGLQVLGGSVEEDIHFDNGIIHTINGSLVLPHNISVSATVGQLFKFLDLMADAEDVVKMESQSDVTVFIPHDAALDKLNPLLSMMTPAQLARLVENHAVSGHVLYHHQLVAEGGKFTTVQGDEVVIRTDTSGQTYANDAKIVRSDLLLYGGVAHIIDAVLVPDNSKDTEDIVSDAQTTSSYIPGLGAIPAQRNQASSWFDMKASSVLQLSAFGIAVLGGVAVLCVRKRRVGQTSPSWEKSSPVMKDSGV